MTQAYKPSGIRGALIYVVIIGSLTGSAILLRSDSLSITLLGPALLIVAGIGVDEGPVIGAIMAVYLALILAPTGVGLVRGKWTRGLLIFQVVLLLPNMLVGLFVVVISGTRM